MRAWKDESLPIKIGDLGRPIIPRAIGPHIFQEAVYDFRASVNIMPKVMEILCCTQTCICSLQINHSATPREFLKTPLFEWDSRRMFL